MYKSQVNTQLSFEDFDQPIGLAMNPENRWIKKAEQIPWVALEKDYAKNFRNNKGNIAKPLRMALGALLIQMFYSWSDEEVVQSIQENPYLQFFIGLPGYQQEKPFDASTMVYFRKRLDATTLAEINEKIIAFNTAPKDTTANDHDNRHDDDSNSGTLIIDATCAPQNIKYPTDTEQLNDARTHAEKIIDVLCETHDLRKPRIYRRKARKVYLSIVKRKKKAKKWLRPKIRQMLGFLKRDIKQIEAYLKMGYTLSEQHLVWWDTIQKIYEQQQYMYDTRVTSVPNRIVSFHQPWLRPIVRGKAKASVEFGAKLDMSIDNGICRLEKVSFEAYNESTVLISAIRHYYDRNGCYPARVLADKIYRNRGNLQYCKARNIRLSGPSLGRRKKDDTRDKVLEYRDNADRVEVERGFSHLKGSFGLGLLRTKRQDTTLTAIVLSIILKNLSTFMAVSLRQIFDTIAIFRKFCLRLENWVQNRNFGIIQ